MASVPLASVPAATLLSLTLHISGTLVAQLRPLCELDEKIFDATHQGPEVCRDQPEHY